jgi:Calcium binding
MARRRPKRDEGREERISMDVVVDCYTEHEQAVGWYVYLDDHLRFPFTATCVAKRAISPLRVRDEVEVIGMAPEDECGHDMFVMIRWAKDGLGVPLAQLKPGPDADDETTQAVEDWHYWVGMGYEL